MKRIAEIHQAKRKRSPAGRKRGCEEQLPKRRAERGVRRFALVFRRWSSKNGRKLRQIAEHLGIPERTLAQWEHDWKQDRLAPKPRGRPAQRADVQARNEVIDYLGQTGPATGVPTLQARFPDLARREVEDLKRRYRKAHARKKHRESCSVEWRQPGAVWAVDFSHAPMPVDGLFPYFLAVRDLASGYQLLWLPTIDETAQTATWVLQALFEEHGPPLVLKSDNGSHFTADQTERLLARENVKRLLSPAGTPQYNGALEAANGWMKIRTAEQALRHGRPNDWTCEDAQAARRLANHATRPFGPNGPTRHQLWQQRMSITQEQRETFALVVEGYRKQTISEHGYAASKCRRRTRGREKSARGSKGSLGKAERVLIERISVRRALGAHGILRVRRGRIPLPLSAQFPANIS